MVLLLRQNSSDIRDRIREAGIDVCACASFKGAVWLSFTPGNTDSVHGIGYPYEGMTSEETLSFIEYDWREHGTEIVECSDVDEFIDRIRRSLDG